MEQEQRAVGIGVVGTGFGARVQIPVWSQVPGVRVLSVASSDRERARRVAEKCGAPHATADVAELAAHPEVDLVCVTTPPHRHHPEVLAALAAGKHVLCEKPFALDARQAFEMRERARAAGVLALVDFEFRRLPVRAELARLLREGAIGTLRHVHQTGIADFLHRVDGSYGAWWYRRESGGGWLGAAASHDIDNLRFLFGEVAEVCALLDTRVPHARARGGAELASEVDDTCFVLLRFADGTPAALLTGAAAVGRVPGGRLELHGSRGSFVLDGGRLLRAEPGGELRPHDVPQADVGGALADPHYVPFALWARAIAAAIRGGSRLTPDFEDGFRNQLVLDAARRSARERRWVGTAEIEAEVAGSAAGGAG
jgi:predicted dehydrogenase